MKRLKSKVFCASGAIVLLHTINSFIRSALIRSVNFGSKEFVSVKIRLVVGVTSAQFIIVP